MTALQHPRIRASHRSAIASAVAALIGASVAAPAAAQSSAEPTTGLQFQMGLTLVSGMNDFEDAVVANNPEVLSFTAVPVGVSLALRYRFGPGLSAVASLGPIVLGTGDASFTVIPLGASVRWDFARTPTGAPYARVGVEHAFANGDYIESGSAGAVAALGYEFGNPRQNTWGIELAYRAVKVDVPGRTAAATKSAQIYKGSLTAYWAF